MSVNKVNSDGSISRVAGGTLYADAPIGTILAYGGTTAPAGWFLCQGQELTKTEYADLYAVIGDAFGTASVNTKFVLPDLTNKTTMGGGTLGASSDGSLPNIRSEKQINLITWAIGNDTSATSALYKIDTAYSGGVSTGASGAWTSIGMDASRNNSLYKDNQSYVEPSNVRVNYIIKAKHVAVPADFMSAVEEVVGETTNWINGTNCKARKVNGIAYVSISHSTVITLRAEATEVAVLPSGFAPSGEISGAFLCDNQRDSALNGRVFPNGSICAWRDTTLDGGNAYDSTSILGFISYPID